VLELEAEVQADPTDHEAWYALGLKQQENEREAAAINALAKVVQLDPDYRPAYLALAVSYTNEGSVEAANAMLAKWIQLDDPTSEHPYAESSMGGGEMSDKAKQEHLVNRLVDIARTRYANGEGELDADVQVALGVLFNASEEWDKARDCFEAALEARPDVSCLTIALARYAAQSS
jgi:peroxin-5